MQTNTQCAEGGRGRASAVTLDGCADLVYGEESMFAFGNSDRYCNENGKCHCVSEPTKIHGYCEAEISAVGAWNLYKFPTKNGNIICLL